MNIDSIKFGEWELMKQFTEELQAFLRKTPELLPRGKYSVFAVGSPRSFEVIINCRSKTRLLRRQFHWDVRTGSWHVALDLMDTVPWGDAEF